MERAQAGYKIGAANLNEVMKMEMKTSLKFMPNTATSRKLSHHDGTNHLLFREIREDRNIEVLLDNIYMGKTITAKMLNYYTKSLYPYVKEVYGW
jgi:hypothetical protein